MTALEHGADDYVTLRRRMGFKFEEAAELLADYIRQIVGRGESLVTIDSALEWAQASGTHPNWWAKRLSVVRGFAKHMAALEPGVGHQVPPYGLVPTRPQRATPFIYAPRDVVSLMEAARELPSSRWALTMEVAIGLLAATGMRIGELVRLDLGDVDLSQGLLTVRSSKFGKSRRVPLHSSTTAALRDYVAVSAKHASGRTALLVSTRGERVRYDSIHRTFHRLARQLGLRHPTTGRPPRIHDLRHSYAVSSLLGWYRSGADAAARMHLLTTYLGHNDPVDTYWYFSATPELMALAAERLEPIEAPKG
jgi:integrase/recombinase XerD